MKVALLALAALASPAGAALTQAELARAVARPPADARLPAALPFTDAHGGATTLGRIAGGRPLVLLFADYTCRHICGPGAALTAQALAGTGLRPGTDYGLAVVGLDPKDGPAAARAFAAHLSLPAALLVGSPTNVAASERALGYGTAYDPDADQWAHDASVYVFGRDGRLVTLLPELGLQPAALRAALAGAALAPSLGERIAHLCYGLAAAQGRYAGPAVLALQALAALTLVALAGFLLRRRRA